MFAGQSLYVRHSESTEVHPCTQEYILRNRGFSLNCENEFFSPGLYISSMMAAAVVVRRKNTFRRSRKH